MVLTPGPRDLSFSLILHQIVTPFTNSQGDEPLVLITNHSGPQSCLINTTTPSKLQNPTSPCTGSQQMLHLEPVLRYTLPLAEKRPGNPLQTPRLVSSSQGLHFHGRPDSEPRDNRELSGVAGVLSVTSGKPGVMVPCGGVGGSATPGAWGPHIGALMDSFRCSMQTSDEHCAALKSLLFLPHIVIEIVCLI